MGINYNMDRQYTYLELSKAKDFYINKIDNFIGKAVLFAKNHDGKNPLIPNISNISNKKENEFIEYQSPEAFIYRNCKNSREHQLDNVIINDFNRTNGTDIESVKVSYGPSSDEYTRSNHALALTIGNMIYFRNGAYKPETEEERKLLMHELTHVAQNKESERNYNETEQEKEREAEINELQGEYNPDPEITIKVKGEYVQIPKSKINQEIDRYTDLVIKQIEKEYKMLPSDGEKINYIKKLGEDLSQGGRKWLQ